MVADLIDKSTGIKVSCSTDNNILADVVIVMEFLDLFRRDGVDDVPDTMRRLTHIVVLN